MTAPLKNDRFLKAIWKEPVDRTPVWIMRQAGRYLPEYRATRQQAGSFMRLCQTPELACEVTLQPLRRYALDASIIFSDILTIPDAMGLGLEFTEGKGPFFTHPLRHTNDIRHLSLPDLDKLRYVYDALTLTRCEIDGKVPLIGFAGSPWTLAAYMMEGQSVEGFPKIQQLRHEDSTSLHHLLEMLATAVAMHLNAQIEAGAQAVMIFDTWGGLLDTNNYLTYSLSYINRAISQLKRTYNSNKVPVMLFTKGGHRWLEQMVSSGSDVLGVDWEISLTDARARVGHQVALQGNLHPACLLESPDTIRAEVKRVIEAFGQGSGHVFNLGHGITPDVPPEHVAVLVDAVHEFSQPYHAST